jgi:hypothetical protein
MQQQAQLQLLHRTPPKNCILRVVLLRRRQQQVLRLWQQVLLLRCWRQLQQVLMQRHCC